MGRDESEYREYLLEQDRRRKFQDEPDEPEFDDGRLVYDFNVSESSPVIRGTWITVNYIVSLIVDGWTWADILRSHPELSEDDIRACLAYTIADRPSEPDDEPLDLDEIDDSDEPDEWEVMDGGPPEINPTTGYPDFGGKPHPVAGSGWQDLDQRD